MQFKAGGWGRKAEADVTCIKVMHYVTAQKDCHLPKSVHYAVFKVRRQIIDSFTYVTAVCLYLVAAVATLRGFLKLLRELKGSK
jgi:hypothetical protein